MLTYYLQTFGCKSNQYESQALRERLAAAGYSEAETVADAAVLVVNTCAVTGRAGASCRNAIRRALRANPALRVVVAGCGVDLGETWPEIPSGPPLLVANDDKPSLPGLLAAWLAGETPAAGPGDAFALSISAFAGHTRAFLKVQDGCDNFCSYCAVPLARGAPRSRPLADVLDEAKRLVDAGYGELVLTGINIGAYRRDGRDFADLVRAVAETPGLLRLRLGSVEPPQLDERLVQAMAGHGKICPHIHLPLQSGSDRILAAMGRRYAAGEFLEKLAMLRERLRAPAVTTDVIVGFPGEDENAFAESEAFCRRAAFSRIHVFLYSPRPGTPAAAMRRTVPDRTVEHWKKKLIATGDALAREFAAACVGLGERIVVERAGARPHGLSDRYVRTILTSPAGRCGELLEARIVEAVGTELIGACVEKPQP